MCFASSVWEIRSSSRHLRIVFPGESERAISPAIFSRSRNSIFGGSMRGPAERRYLSVSKRASANADGGLPGGRRGATTRVGPQPSCSRRPRAPAAPRGDRHEHGRVRGPHRACEPFFAQDRIRAVGPVTGTLITMSGRVAAVTKSPLTGTITDSHSGAWWGAALKWAGLDAVVFTGKSKEPVYAAIQKGKVELRSAKSLWGQGTSKTTDLLEKKQGKDSRVLAIGPAGENRVRFACIIND